MKKKSVFTQLVFILFLISVVPVSLIIYYNGRGMQKNSEKVIAEQMLEKMEANGRLSDALLSNIMYLSLDIVLTKEYIPLNNINTYDELNAQYQSVIAAMKVYQQLKNLTDRNDLVCSAFYYTEGSDYVIASNGYVIRKREYGDLQWLDEIINNSKRVKGIWYPRQIAVSGEADKEESIPVISYVYHISSLFTSANGVIVVDVDEKALNHLITSEETTMFEGGIVDSAGSVICYSDETKLYGSVSESAYIKDILELKQPSGWGVSKESNEKILYTYLVSDLYDWIYINTYSIESVFADSAAKLNSSILQAMGILFAGSIFVVFLALKISQPIKRLVKEFSTVTNDFESEDCEKNELEYLAEAVEKIRIQEKELNEKLQDREYVARRAVIGKLLFGEQISNSETVLLTQWFPYNHFIVCILAVDGLTKYQQETTHEVREYHRYLINEMIKEHFPDWIITGTCRYSSASIAVILNIKEYDRSLVMRQIKETIASIQIKCKKELGVSLSVGVSSVHNYFDNARICAEEAYEATKLRMLCGAGQILLYQDNEIERTAVYQGYIHEKRLSNYLESGDIDHISQELDQMVSEIKELHSISIDNITMVFNQLIGKVMIYLNENQFNANHVFGSYHNLYSSLSQKETLDEIKDFMVSIYEMIIVYQDKNGSKTEEDMCRMVLLYLQEHFKEDIDFEAVADMAGLSYSHLRKVIREESGKSLSDNLNLIRVEVAKEYLLNSDDPIAVIAERVGYHNVQAINRFFKKYEGITPGEYREKHHS